MMGEKRRVGVELVTRLRRYCFSKGSHHGAVKFMEITEMGKGLFVQQGTRNSAGQQHTGDSVAVAERDDCRKQAGIGNPGLERRLVYQGPLHKITDMGLESGGAIQEVAPEITCRTSVVLESAGMVPYRDPQTQARPQPGPFRKRG